MRKQLTIGVVTQQFGRVLSGPGLHARNLVKRLMADGHKVIVIAPSNQLPLDHSDCQLIEVPSPRIKSHLRWFPLSWQFSRAVADCERKQAVDLWHFTDAREALFCRSRRPLVGNINDTYAAEGLSLRYYRSNYADGPARWFYYASIQIVDRWAWEHFAVLLANSQYTADVIRHRYPSLKDRLIICYKSVDSADFVSVWKRREGLPQHPLRVLCVGGNMQRKGISTLIRAIPSVAAVLPNIEFWIVGQDPTIPRLKALSLQLGSEDRIHFLGWKSQTELIELYAEIDVFAMPSLTEAFGVVFLEAMAAGVPAIGTSVGGIPEIIQDGWNGLLVPPQSPSELAAAILKVLSSSELQDRFRKNGLTTAHQFSIDRMMEGTYAAYQKRVKNE